MSDFEKFSSTFQGELVTPSDPGYDAAIARWSRKSIRRAKIVAFVKNSEDVSAALKFAKDAGLKIAVRGGGHNPAAASSAEDGLVIDLSKFLNKVEVNPEKKLAYVQGGALWKTVDEETIKHGLATVGGTVNHTGVGGLILGGGYGYLTGLHGLAIDNLESVTIITADGTSRKASQTENPDLFWGIRGGGSNFGVVTEFVLRLHPHPRTIFCGPAFYTPDKLDAIARQLDIWWPQVKPNEACFVVFVRGPDKNPVIILSFVYHGPEKEGRENFKAFYDIGPIMDLASEKPYPAVNGLQNEHLNHGSNYFMKGILLSRTPSTDVSQSNFDTFVQQTATPDHSAIVAYEFVSQAKVNSVPELATPFRRDSPGNGIVLVKWDQDTEEATKKGREIAYTLSTLGPKGVAYGNYAESEDLVKGTEEDGEPDKSKVFYAKAYPRLQELKKKYDPESVFHKWYPITPAA